MMQVADVKALIWRDTIKYGSLRKLAAKMKISPAYLSDVRLGNREPGPSVLDFFGLEKVVTTEYRKKR